MQSKNRIMVARKWTALFILLAVLALPFYTTGRASEISGGSAPYSFFLPSLVKQYSIIGENADRQNAEVPLAWYDLVYGLVKAEKIPPPIAARIFGYTGVALYEALVPGMPTYRSLAGQLSGLNLLPSGPKTIYHWPAVANSALATILTHLFQGRSEASLNAIRALYQEYAGQFMAKMSPEIYTASAVRGQTVADAIAGWADTDGYKTLNGCAYTPPAGPGLWEPTPPGYAAALQPCWGQIRTMVPGLVLACHVGSPPAYSENPASQLYQEASEVVNVVAHLTTGQREIADFWADNAGETGTPPGHSISILSQIIAQERYPLSVAAEAYARVGIAVDDAFITCWRTKFEYNLLRPVTYIQDLIDPDWLPPLNTPPFPEYTSGHSVQSGAAALVMFNLFGDIPFIDHTHEDLGLSPRSFNTFSDFAAEAAISRLYGGIHFRTAIEVGLEQGKCVGRKVSALQFHDR